jgi:hypothetical protein
VSDVGTSSLSNLKICHYNFFDKSYRVNVVGNKENVDRIVTKDVVETHCKDMIWSDVPQDHVHGSI